MKFTKGQLKDLETIEYFAPRRKNCEIQGVLTEDIVITDEDKEMFLDYSERGIEPSNTPGVELLLQGKRWRGIHMEMYEEDLMGGMGIGYISILGGEEGDEIMPRSVVDFMKREMFKGIDATLIEECYQGILDKKENVC